MKDISRREFGAVSAGAALAAGVAGAATAGAQTGGSVDAATSDALGSQMRLPPDKMLKYVHPELRAIRARQMHGAPGSNPAAFAPPAVLSSPSVSERTIAGPASLLHAFVINSVPGGTPKPAILHFHGGGMVSGDARRGVPNLQKRCAQLDCTAVTVDYRLAPGTHHPGQVDDAFAALLWLRAHAAELNIDPARIAIIGESAGGGLAAMLAIRARDEGVPVLFQALMYPMLDDRSGSIWKLPPHVEQGGNSSWSTYLGVSAGSDKVPYGIPGRVKNLEGLAPAFISAGSIDSLAFASIDYARRLMEVGVMVELYIAPGAYHAFNAVDTELGRTFTDAYYHAIGRAFTYGV